MGGANCWGKGLQKGAREWGQGGWGKGWGKGGGRGWNLYLNEVLNKKGIISRLGCRNERYDTKSWGNPRFWGNPCCNDITFLKICHNLAKKSPKMRMREISAVICCAMPRRKKGGHLGNLKNWLT